jgi:hypothetical protein
MRENDRAHLRDGLAAVAAIELAPIDFRDLSTPVWLLRFAAAKLEEFETQAIFGEAAALANGEVAESMLAPLKRPWDWQSSGFVMVESKCGLGLIHKESRPYSASYPLEQIIVDLAELIREDYRPANLRVGTDLPRTWLTSVDDHVLNSALQEVRAGAGLTGLPPYAQSVADADQMLSLFLVELCVESAAEDLLRLTNMKKKKGHDAVLLAVKHARLFCLLVERATTGSRLPAETPSSIGRLAQPITRLLQRYIP